MNPNLSMQQVCQLEHFSCDMIVFNFSSGEWQKAGGGGLFVEKPL